MLRTDLHGHSCPGVIPVTAMVSGALGVPLWWDPNGENLPVVGAYRAIATVGSPWPLAPAVYADTLLDWSGNQPNLIEGLGAVPWAANAGWGFNAALTQYLSTGIIPAAGWSMLVQYANRAGGVYATGSFTGGNTRLQIGIAVGGIEYGNGGFIVVAPGQVTGNAGVAGQQGYRNGVAEGALIAAWAGVSVDDVWIGCRNQGGVANGFVSADVESVAIYNGVLTAPQVLAVATAMAAL
jgi:hypothetical protein